MNPSPPIGSGKFPSTRWTLLLAAGSQDQQQSRDALETLCATYWYPVYVYIRSQGHSREESQDFTQDFFTGILSRQYFDLANPERGRFRSFLLSSVKFFLADQARASRAQKRGGGTDPLPFEIVVDEESYLREASHNETPSRIFDRRWAQALLDRVISRLRDDFSSHGRLEHFDRLKIFLLGQSDIPYAELATQLSTTEGALKVSISRLRKRYRDLIRAEIADTVADPSEVESELRYLFDALSRR